MSQTPTSTKQQHKADSLVSQIGRGGPLADLFFRAVREQIQATQVVLNSDRTEKSILQLIADARQRIEQEAEESPLALLRQCAAGCDACCSTVVADVTPLEALVIAEYLTQHHEEAEIAAIRDRLAASASRYEELSVEDGPRVSMRCPLLNADGLCSVYEARPLVCMGVFSLSREACEAASRQPGDPIPLDRPAKVWMMGVSGGLQRALARAKLDANLYELNSAVLRALETPDAVGRWLRGEDVFDGCFCTDPHSPPRKPRTTVRLDGPNAKQPKSHVRNRRSSDGIESPRNRS